MLNMRKVFEFIGLTRPKVGPQSTVPAAKMVKVQRGSLRSAPADASRPACKVVMSLNGYDATEDEDITDMIDWFYVIEYERSSA